MPNKRHEKVRHHTVPKHYLEGFARHDGFVTQYPRDGHPPRDVHVRHASVVRRMYSILSPDGTWDDSIEDYFMRLEGNAWPILKKLRFGAVPSKEEKGIFSLYLARQIQRGQYVANIARIEADKFRNYEFVLKVVESNWGELVARYGDNTMKNSLREFKEGRAGVNISDKAYLAPLIAETPFHAAIIAGMSWTVQEAVDGVFVTSDHPVCVRRADRANDFHVVGLMDQEAELTFPLDRKTTLIATNAIQSDWHQSVDAQRVLELNRRTVISAFRFVFSPLTDPILENLIAEHNQDRIQFGEMNWCGTAQSED